MLQVAAPNEIVVAVVFDVKVGEVRGQVNLCIPATVVETAGAQVAVVRPRQRRELSPTERHWLDENFGRIPFPVVPQIRTRLKAAAVLALKPGEVVALPLAVDQPLDVYVGGIRKLTGRLAAEHGRLLVYVEERVQSGPTLPARGI